MPWMLCVLRSALGKDAGGGASKLRSERVGQGPSLRKRAKTKKVEAFTGFTA